MIPSFHQLRLKLKLELSNLNSNQTSLIHPTSQPIQPIQPVKQAAQAGVLIRNSNWRRRSSRAGELKSWLEQCHRRQQRRHRVSHIRIELEQLSLFLSLSLPIP